MWGLHWGVTFGCYPTFIAIIFVLRLTSHYFILVLNAKESKENKLPGKIKWQEYTKKTEKVQMWP